MYRLLVLHGLYIFEAHKHATVLHHSDRPSKFMILLSEVLGIRKYVKTVTKIRSVRTVVTVVRR
jgi:hypothetical protein